jgi:hypothetical protein
MMLRASGLADVTTYYRHAWPLPISALPKNGHGFMPTTGTLPNGTVAFREIAIGAQRQIAMFFFSGGTTIVHAEPQRFFEVPVQLPLPEVFNYIP